jgi:hypothetical protein
MNKFLCRFFLFFTPLFGLALVVLVIDPYNYFFTRNFIPNEVKLYVINRTAESMPRGNTLWKLIDFEKHPSKNILIGDSRAFDLNVDTIKKISDIQFYNFGVPGGNYNSIIETFWYVNSIIKPERVYIQVGFHNYSANSEYNLVADAKKVCKRPYFFFSRYYFLQESVQDVYYSTVGIPDSQNDGKFDKKNWNLILKNQGNSSLVSMKYPAKYHEELKKISAYCSENNIELVFIIFPDQQDFHNLIAEHSLGEVYRKYKEDIYSFGKVYDFDEAGSDISKNRSNYRDIFHLKHELIYRDIIRGIWKKKE